MLPWLFPVGVFVAVALISVSSPLGYILALGWAWVVFPCGAGYIRSHARTPDGDGNGDADADTNYWRTRLW